jgi:hypothetical protein
MEKAPESPKLPAPFSKVGVTARDARAPPRQFIVGMTNSAPSLTPDGQREVTVLVLV